MSIDQPVTAVIETLEDATEDDETRVGDILDEFGNASFPPVLLAISLLLVSPLSGVPLFSSICGMAIFIVSFQALVRREHIWLPRRIKAWKLDTKRSDRFLNAARRAAGWLDRGTDARMTVLVTPPASHILYALTAMGGLMLPLLEFVPLSSSIMGAGTALVATGILARDGLISVLGLCVLMFAAAIPIVTVLTLLGYFPGN